ncbi:UNVERIFIED_CONTAM: hypothetical protein FKN15_064457 [Acipenser sinensis]
MSGNQVTHVNMPSQTVWSVFLPLQPRSGVEDPAFKALLKLAQPSYTLPTHKHLSYKLVPCKTSSLQSTITSDLATILGLCLTVAIGSGRDMRSYIGITGHFIDNFKMKNIMLACRRVKGSHNAEHPFKLPAELFEGENKLQAANATRWNSQVKMMKSILKGKHTTMEKLNFPCKLSKYEINLIKELVEILCPFVLATDQIEGDSQVTVSSNLPCISGLRAELAKLSNTYKSKMVSSLQSSIDNCVAKYENEEAFTLAAALDL